MTKVARAARLQLPKTQSASDFGLKETAEKAKAVRGGNRFLASARETERSAASLPEAIVGAKPMVVLATASSLALETEPR